MATIEVTNVHGIPVQIQISELKPFLKAYDKAYIRSFIMSGALVFGVTVATDIILRRIAKTHEAKLDRICAEDIASLLRDVEAKPNSEDAPEA